MFWLKLMSFNFLYEVKFCNMLIAGPRAGWLLDMSLLLQFPLQLFLLVNENTKPFQMERRSGNNVVLSICDLFRFFCCEACFTTSSKLLSQDAVHISIWSHKPVSPFVQKRLTALLSLRTEKHNMKHTWPLQSRGTAYEDVM